MRVFVRSGLLTLMTLAVVAAGSAVAQTPPTAKATAPAAKSAAPAVGRLANPQQVLATVNGESVTKADLLNLLVRYQIPFGNDQQQQQIYHDGIETLVNTKLVNQFLIRQRLPVSEEKVDAELAQLEKDLKAEGRDLATVLVDSGTTMAEVRKELASHQRWMEYVRLKATDAELKKYVANNKDLFSGTQVRTSHIILKVEPETSAAEKEKIKQRLLQIKTEIESGKMTFAQAANKLSEDPTKTEGDGGDIGYFGKNTGIIEEFADAAFALKPGKLSDPVETVHGFHLILVTDRKEGAPIDIEAKKPFVNQMYAAELQKNLLVAVRKDAKIDVKPMPSDLFPPIPTPAAAAAGAGAVKEKAPAAKP